MEGASTRTSRSLVALRPPYAIDLGALRSPRIGSGIVAGPALAILVDAVGATATLAILEVAGFGLQAAVALVIAFAAPAIAALIGFHRTTGTLVTDRALEQATPAWQLSVLTTLVACFVAGLQGDALAPGLIVALPAVLTACILLAHPIVHRLLARPERCLLVGTPAAREEFTRHLGYAGGHGLELIGEYGMDAVPALNARLADLAADRIIVLCDTGENGAAEAMELTSRARELGLRASVVMRPLAHMGAGLVSEQVAGSLVLHAPRRGGRELLKRTADVIGSVLGLIALSPVMALFALAIKLDSRGPVFFRQNRTGRDGEEFEVLKFRTMVADAEALKEGLRDANEADGLFKLEHDPRVTRPGRWLRATSLDELPQLLNVLRGQMGLVGPRPLVPEEAGAVAGAHRAMRLSVRPGMTGPWQVMGSARIGISDMGAIDHLYASDGTIAADAKLILRTAGVVVGRRGM